MTVYFSLPLVCLSVQAFAAETLPIQFSIPESKILAAVPTKDLDFAHIIPGRPSTYIYDDEQSYYEGYQRAYFAVTNKKSGWDCLRHYEILANGCVPYFLDLDEAPVGTMFMLPRALIKQAMTLPGVSYLHIDHSLFDEQRYFDILGQLMHYTRQHLSTRAMAQYFLDAIGYTRGTILFLSGQTYPDYLRCLTLIGLKEILGTQVIDSPKIKHIYKSYDGNATALYGKGISYTRVVDDHFVDRGRLENRIAEREFAFIVYGSLHRGLPFHNIARAHYAPKELIYLDGEDLDLAGTKPKAKMFLREFQVLNKSTHYFPRGNVYVHDVDDKPSHRS